MLYEYNIGGPLRTLRAPTPPQPPLSPPENTLHHPKTTTITVAAPKQSTGKGLQPVAMGVK